MSALTNSVAVRWGGGKIFPSLYFSCYGNEKRSHTILLIKHEKFGKFRHFTNLGVSWLYLVCLGISRRISTFFGVSRYLSARLDISWQVLAFLGVSRDFSVCLSISRHILTFSGISRHSLAFLAFLNISRHSQHFLGRILIFVRSQR